jgi:hypothetical protein
MPLAQNYKDDVSLLESEAALAKPSMVNLPERQEFTVSRLVFRKKLSMNCTLCICYASIWIKTILSSNRNNTMYDMAG